MRNATRRMNKHAAIQHECLKKYRIHNDVHGPDHPTTRYWYARYLRQQNAVMRFCQRAIVTGTHRLGGNE